MNDTTIVKDLLPEDCYKELFDKIDSHDFPWYFYDEICVGENTDKYVTESCAICHTVFMETINSGMFPLIEPILDCLKNKTGITCSQILRIRIRRTMQTIDHTIEKYNRPHIDLLQKEPFTTMVYYLEDSDGDTVLFDKSYVPGMDIESFDYSVLKVEQRVQPKKNTGLIFDGFKFHSGNNPVNYKKRTIINFDFVQ